MPYKEKPIIKRYYTIRELSKELRVNSSLLRYYEDEGVITSDLRSKSDMRKYTAQNVQRIRLVIQYQRTGFFTIKALSHIYKFGHLPEISIEDSLKNQ